MEKTCPQGVYYFSYLINILNMPVWGVLKGGRAVHKRAIADV